MNVPRVRMVAGPNGSGKTTLVNHLRGVLGLAMGFYLNPDELDREIARSGRVDLANFGITPAAYEVQHFIERHPLAFRAEIRGLSFQGSTVFTSRAVPTGYLASILSDYVRRTWLTQRVTFTFETVMSSDDKLQFLADARARGYRTYLYYVCTDTPLINQGRIANRVRDGGHDVPLDKILSRYERSLAQLPKAIALSDRAYLFDNSGQTHRMFAEFDSGRPVHVDPTTPHWFRAIKV